MYMNLNSILSHRERDIRMKIYSTIGYNYFHVAIKFVRYREKRLTVRNMKKKGASV